MDLLHGGLAVLCGALVGFTLGLIGGGGSIMATPLLLYVVGLPPHVAIGTGALAVSANAFANFGGYARQGMVRWQCAILFSIVGVVGAAGGSFLGKEVDGKRLIFLFAILMIVVGILMLRRKERPGVATSGSGSGHHGGEICRLWQPAARHQWPLLGTGLGVGAMSGFFGIGGGFLIVPGLLFATGMPMICAIGSSLLAVGAFGLTTAISYGSSGLVDWTVAAEYILGGFAGGMIGMALTKNLAGRKAVLNRVFAGFVFVVAVYMLYQNGIAARL